MANGTVVKIWRSSAGTDTDVPDTMILLAGVSDEGILTADVLVISKPECR